MITFKTIDKENERDAFSIQVNTSQERFLTQSIQESLKEAEDLRDEGISVETNLILKDKSVVGYIMLSIDICAHELFKGYPLYNKNVFFINQFIIDRNHQGQHNGKDALFRLLENLDKTYDYIVLFYHKDNLKAQLLYESLGFITTSLIMDNSVFAYKTLT